MRDFDFSKIFQALKAEWHASKLQLGPGTWSWRYATGKMTSPVNARVVTMEGYGCLELQGQDVTVLAISNRREQVALVFRRV